MPWISKDAATAQAPVTIIAYDANTSRRACPVQ
jgi:hypothetical protein